MSIAPTEIELQGIEQVLREFERLDRRMQQNIVGKAGRKALDVVVPMVRQDIQGLPFRNPPSPKNVRGSLYASVKKRTSNKPGLTVVSAFFDYKNGGAVRLAHLFEFGFNHPGGSRMKAYLMMSKALSTQSDRMQEIIAERMRELIEQAVPR